MTHETSTYEAWLKEMDAEACRRGYAMAGSFVAETGDECWRASFDEGLTPGEALTRDEACA